MKKRIALITKGFTGSTFPLAKQFLEMGYAVDIYLFYYISFSELEAFNCSYKSSKYGVEEIAVNNWIEMFSYLGESDSVRLFSLKMPRPYENIPIVRNIIGWYSDYYAIKSSSFINDQNYKIVNIIGGYYSHEYLSFLKKLNCKIVVSLHEVCDHFHPDFSKPSPLLKFLFQNSIDIIIYSDNSLHDILNYKDVKREKIHRLNFGLFETFKTIPVKNALSLPKKYFLFFGSILPYKGLPILNEAMKLLTDYCFYYKLVVAGKGNDPCLEDLSNNPNVLLINKRLSNAELCEVIGQSLFVICPYFTMSQSGIPQTVYTFGKPIIASDLDGFREILTHKKNGLLFANNEPIELAECIKTYLNNEKLLAYCSSQVMSFEKDYPEFSWSNIARKFVMKFVQE